VVSDEATSGIPDKKRQSYLRRLSIILFLVKIADPMAALVFGGDTLSTAYDSTSTAKYTVETCIVSRLPRTETACSHDQRHRQ
jgi:hypothetical protein